MENNLKKFEETLKKLKITNFNPEIDKIRQYFSYSLKYLWILILITMVFLLIPMTPQKLANGDVYTVGVLQSLNNPAVAGAICYGMIVTAAYTHLLSEVLHQMTYKDVLRLFRKARKKGTLFSLDEEEQIIKIIKDAEIASKQKELERKRRTKEMLEKNYEDVSKNVDIAEDIKNLLTENEKLKSIVAEYEEIKKDAENSSKTKKLELITAERFNEEI